VWMDLIAIHETPDGFWHLLEVLVCKQPCPTSVRQCMD
jgi:hypothetical protein